MGPKTTPDDAKSSTDAEGAALDRLYAAALDAFVAQRRELAAELRRAGETHASRRVATAPKPSRTAWALNQVARRQPKVLTAVLEARATAVAAQKSGAPTSVRATARVYRERVSDAVHAAREFLREAGSQLTATQGRRLGATVQALAGAEDAKGRARLLGGRLVADVDVDDPFAGLEIVPAQEHREAATSTPPPRDDLAPRRAARAAAEAAARERIAQREHEKRAHELEKARARVRSLETEVSEARASARHAEVAASRAQSEAERARRAADALEQRLDEARRALPS